MNFDNIQCRQLGSYCFDLLREKWYTCIMHIIILLILVRSERKCGSYVLFGLAIVFCTTVYIFCARQKMLSMLFAFFSFVSSWLYFLFFSFYYINIGTILSFFFPDNDVLLINGLQYLKCDSKEKLSVTKKCTAVLKTSYIFFELDDNG